MYIQIIKFDSWVPYDLDKYSQKRNEHEFFQFQRYGIYRIFKTILIKKLLFKT